VVVAITATPDAKANWTSQRRVATRLLRSASSKLAPLHPVGPFEGCGNQHATEMLEGFAQVFRGEDARLLLLPLPPPLMVVKNLALLLTSMPASS